MGSQWRHQWITMRFANSFLMRSYWYEMKHMGDMSHPIHCEEEKGKERRRGHVIHGSRDFFQRERGGTQFRHLLH